MKALTAGLRQRVVDLCLELSHRGYFSGTGGNLAIRFDATYFAVTPSATDYQTMTADNVSILKLDDLAQSEGDRPPSVESSLHAHVLRARPDVNCSIHTHQPIASACSLLGNSIDVAEATMREALGPYVPVVGYAPSGTRWLAAKFARTLRPDVNAYLMFNHGALCCANSIENTVRNVEHLEALARQHLRERIAKRAAANAGMQPTLCRVLALLDA